MFSLENANQSNHEFNSITMAREYLEDFNWPLRVKTNDLMIIGRIQTQLRISEHWLRWRESIDPQKHFATDQWRRGREKTGIEPIALAELDSDGYGATYGILKTPKAEIRHFRPLNYAQKLSFQPNQPYGQTSTIQMSRFVEKNYSLSLNYFLVA